MSTMSVASQVRSENTSLHKRKQADLAPETDCYCNPPLKSNWKVLVNVEYDWKHPVSNQLYRSSMQRE